VRDGGGGGLAVVGQSKSAQSLSVEWEQCVQLRGCCWEGARSLQWGEPFEKSKGGAERVDIELTGATG